MVKTLIIALILLSVTGAGAAGTYMMSDGMEWTGGHHGMMGAYAADCPGEEHYEDCPHEDVEECEDHAEECEEHYEDCGHGSFGRGC
jgi:hypothetical protein